MIVKWKLSIGYSKSPREGEFCIHEDASDGEIENVVKREMYKCLDWSWEKFRPSMPPLTYTELLEKAKLCEPVYIKFIGEKSGRTGWALTDPSYALYFERFQMSIRPDLYGVTYLAYPHNPYSPPKDAPVFDSAELKIISDWYGVAECTGLERLDEADHALHRKINGIIGGEPPGEE